MLNALINALEKAESKIRKCKDHNELQIFKQLFSVLLHVIVLSVQYVQCPIVHYVVAQILFSIFINTVALVMVALTYAFKEQQATNGAPRSGNAARQNYTAVLLIIITVVGTPIRLVNHNSGAPLLYYLHVFDIFFILIWYPDFRQETAFAPHTLALIPDYLYFYVAHPYFIIASYNMINDGLKFVPFAKQFATMAQQVCNMCGPNPPLKSICMIVVDFIGPTVLHVHFAPKIPKMLESFLTMMLNFFLQSFFGMKYDELKTRFADLFFA